METIETAEGTKFLCSCDGCRGWTRRVALITHASELDSKTEGHFFSPSTMRFFSSRVVSWKQLANPQQEGIERDGLAVIVSSRYGYDGAERYYELVLLCQYGELTRERAEDSTIFPFTHYATPAKARKALAGIGYPTSCPCHGCQLDRKGR